MGNQTFADDLRERSDQSLKSMLEFRPDLLTPLPADITSLAIRATSTHSLIRALDLLTNWELDVLTAAATLDEPFNIKELEKIIDKSISPAVKKLHELGLFYGDNSQLKIPNNLRILIGEDPAGLGPKATIKADLDLLATAPKEAKLILEHLTWETPRGQVSNMKSPPTGVSWLLDNDFLTILDSHTVALPREIGIYLRGGKIFRDIRNTPPEIAGNKILQSNIDTGAIANISDFLRWCEELAQYWANDPANIIKTGGIGVRDLKRTCEHLGLAENLTSFLADLLFQTELIGIDGNGEVLPTQNYDLWLKQDPEAKWLAIAQIWLNSSRYLGENLTPLSNDLERANLVANKKLLIESLIDSPEIETEVESLLKRLEWKAPRRFNSNYIQQILRETEWLGITGRGGLSSYGINFLDGNKASLEIGINKAFPKNIDYILIQSDYTAIAPGPLEYEIADQIELIADIEGRGSATVFRFTAKSIRRGLDHGMHGADILEFLKKTSKTQVPQPLEYLIQDCAKKHGKLKVGHACAFLRNDDENIVTEIANNKKIEDLGVRKIADTVLIFEAEIEEVLEVLRQENYFPVAEGKNGVLISAPISRRLKLKRNNSNKFRENQSSNSQKDLAEVAIKALRVREKVTSVPTFDLPKNSAQSTLNLLQSHIEDNSTVAIGYADSNGHVSNRLIDPISIKQGILTAKDHATGKIETFRIPRITGVVQYDDVESA